MGGGVMLRVDGGVSAESGLQYQVCSPHTLSACLSLKLRSAANRQYVNKDGFLFVRPDLFGGV